MTTAEGGVSPVLAQWRQAKSEHPEAILLFRLGDFFETFEDDAESASAILGITLTSRDFGKIGRRPMAGFPQQSVEGHVARLLAAGRSVAICDQVEAASAARGLVRREVIRVLTPGTVVEGALLDPGKENSLLALSWDHERIGIAALEVSTGRIELSELPLSATAQLAEIVERLRPSEVLVSEEGESAVMAWRPVSAAWRVSHLEGWRFDASRGRERALAFLGVASLRGFDAEDLGPALGSLSAALDYLQRNRLELPSSVARVRRVRPGVTMHLDGPTIANLELVDGLGGGGPGVLGLLDRTRTPVGARTLRGWLLNPLLDVQALDQRLEAVDELASRSTLREELLSALGRVRDLERLTARTAQARATPRDLGAIRDSLPLIAVLQESLVGAESVLLSGLRDALTPEPGLSALLADALVESLPPSAADGGIVRDGFDEKLDVLRRSIRDAQQWIAGLEQKERDATGIRGLKVGFNRVFGYYIEISNANRVAVPESYQRKQTLAGAERYVTPELKEKESAVLHGEQVINAREREVFEQLCGEVARRATPLLATAEAIGAVDALTSLAAAAIEHAWVRPSIHEGYDVDIRDGRHPMVEAALGPGHFVPNDVLLEEGGRVMLLTGPNMAGKSTYLRQVGLLVLLAQVGSFVPASSASIGMVDRIFTRVGAQDAIAQGLSTFMVEMVETSNILNHATRDSLVIFDEIGRGTSTYDGMSIAQAVVEQIHDSPQLGCRTLFATHFHELTALAGRLPALRNHRVEVSEEGGRITFLHRIVPGGADRSYGIHVADIAGLPPSVTARAREILAALEAARPLAGAREGGADQLALPISVPHAVMRELAALEIDNLSPLEALNRLARLKELGQTAVEPSR
ncbi:MAG: DNA mismatch repair protein MutS [Candidatus Dormibacteria bacterium]